MTKLNYSEECRFEKISTEVCATTQEGAVAVARTIANLIRSKQEKGENAVLGLATGSTPVKVYEELVRMHQEEGLSFKNVLTFNLDEYFPMSPGSVHSYVYFMNEYLFNHVDIKPENINIPDGTLPTDPADVAEFCRAYEQKIQSVGGVDLQILGIGRNGHIGFNEPGSARNSGTRMITLDNKTRVDAAKTFYGKENVPRRAITMGIGTIMNAKSIILMAWGQSKSEIIKRAVEGEISNHVPATYLQEHEDVQFVLDESAAQDLTRFSTPWLVKMCDWSDKALRRKAVVWLCQNLKKPILKLTDEDYNENGMSDLITQQGPAYTINIQIFNELQHTITGWPGGKPNADDTNRPERATPDKKRVVIFSPHPDDDVISMGGTFIRLVDQGHEVHVAYQTSGNIAVFDDDALRFADFLNDFNREFGFNNSELTAFYERVRNYTNHKKTGEEDTDEIRLLKGLIRRGEARAGCRASGLSDRNAHFLNLPFYETGKTRKNPVGQEDIQILKDFLNQIQPHQVYAAGDLADPHGTHKVCLDAIFEALTQLKAEEEWTKDCWMWLYRGAWHEWAVHEIEMAVPISPEELLRKRKAIFKHQSQKDTPVFPGNDPREFWQRAEDRNKETALIYNALGLAEYEAMEAFVRWHY